MHALSVLTTLLAEQAATLPAPQAVSARNAVVELVAAVVRGEHAPLRSTDLRATIDRWVEANLHASVTAGEAAAAHAISERTLARLYQRDGEGYARHVRRLRLARARRELLDGTELISVIAHRWGFADASHFTRRFVEEYGVTPSEARDQNRESP